MGGGPRTKERKDGESRGLRSPIGLTFLNGLAVSLACTPLDVIKNYWIYRDSSQVLSRGLGDQGGERLIQGTRGVNTWRVIRELYKYRGLGTFWTGLLPTMMFNIPSNIIFLNTYYYLLNTMGFSPGIAGVQARTITTLFVSPMEFIRTRVQAQIGSELYWNISGAGGRVNGLKSPILDSMKCLNVHQLWSGLWITILRDVPFTAVYWTLTERLRERMVPAGDSENGTRTLRLFSIAAFSGTVATLVSHPLDIIKTNIQTHSFNQSLLGRGPISPRKMVSSLFQKRGLGYFYTGLFPRIIKIVPSCAISLALFELCRN
ncbi:mitochondrial carrier protein MRS2 [Cryptosporidium canis]|uniref:Mitochondrial carrier protein MRS2 n=1 Tax=Cryptosporidium canis TaxID=195482 RepID=A0ABQ8P634_9CRYT|nr:mitochondrial carrier protein MRS2 [Cryptosporidium canis]